jgi:outer membrane protein OmpA-like peptidoglycan-associated protein
MRMTVTGKGLVIVAALMTIGSMCGCSGYEYNTKQMDYPYGFIHKELPQADRAVETARREGKDKQCPAEFKAAEDLKNKAYDVYAACHTKEAIDLANEATAKAQALCPPVAAQEAPLPPVPVTEPLPGKAKYCISLNILYDINKTVIRDEYRDEVGRVATFMKKFPETTAVIEGYADDVGTEEHNMQLSQQRAEGVVDYLVEKFGIERSRLSAKGYGETRPVAENSTEAGKQKNRRIEAVIDCAVAIKGLKPVPDRLCLNLKVEFDTDKADIKPQYHDEIAKVADFMKENPTVTGLVEGHTDNVGAPDYNMKLSQRRAESVVNYLVEKFGIDRSRLSAKGYGDTRRIAYNSSPEGRAKNRRVNVILDCVIKK